MAVDVATSLRRGVLVLQALGAGEALGVLQIARLVGQDKSQVSRTLKTLAEYGLVDRDPETRAYRLGWGVFALAARAGDTRLLAEGEPMAIELLHVRESLLPGLTATDLEEDSFYELLPRRYGIEIAGGEQTVEPTVTDEEESETLGVPLHSPALLFERVTRSPQGDVVEYTVSIYRGDRYRIVSELGQGGQPAQPLSIVSRAATG